MGVPRFYAPSLSQKVITLSEEESRHGLSVLRLKVGDKVCLFDGKGREGEGEIIAIQGKKIQVSLLRVSSLSRELPGDLKLALSVCKEDAFSQALRGATELGVKVIQPILTKRSRPLPREKWEKCLVRWRRVVENACKQCGRNEIPKVKPILSLDDFVSSQQGETFLLATPRGTPWSFELFSSLPLSLWLVVGPEGGLTEEEETLFCKGESHKVCAFSFGKSILRVETAVVAFVTLVAAQWIGQWKSFSST